MRIDSHQHFWVFNPARDDWIDGSMADIRRDFMPPDLKPNLDVNRFDGCVAVQAAESHDETRFLLDLSSDFPWIKKIVGWIDLRSQRLEQEMDQWSGNGKLAGFRQVIQCLDPSILYQPEFRAGLSRLSARSFTFDLLICPQHLQAAIDLVGDFPDQLFVIDHLAKPAIKSGMLEPWRTAIKQVASHENVYCKFSGMVTEANWHAWTYDDLAPYMEWVLECFGPSRLMYGSDWPVALLASSYQQVFDVAERFVGPLSADEKQQLLGSTACHFYGIDH